MILSLFYFPKSSHGSKVVFFACFVMVSLLATTIVDSAYVVVDTVNCVNMLDLLMVKPGINHSFDLSGVTLQYDLRSIAVTDHSLFQISQPHFSLSPDVHDFPNSKLPTNATQY